MQLLDELRILIGCYYGVRELEDYELNIYIMEKVKKYIDEFVLFNNIDLDIVNEEFTKIENYPLKRKLQDSLLTFNTIKVPMELQLLVKRKINELNRPDNN